MGGEAFGGRRLLVCGGRDFLDVALVEWALGRVLAERGIACIIEGECPTADNPDKMSGQWGDANGIQVHRCPVDHTVDGPWPGAGPKRNRRMRDTHRPDAGLAFPRTDGSWGSGTMGMIRLLGDIGVKTWMVAPTQKRPQG